MIVLTTQNFFPDVGGIEIYVTGLADTLAARGNRLTVFCDSTSGHGQTSKPYSVLRFSGPRPWSRWRKGLAVTRCLRDQNVNAVVADSWKSLEHVSPDELSETRVICLAHGAELLVAPESSKGRRIARSIAKADIVAANSGFTEGLIRPFLSRRTSSRVVLPGVYPPTVPPVSGDTSGTRILTVARLDAYKGVDIMLEAIAALRLRHPQIRYDVAGTGAELGRLRALRSKLELESHVTFHGRVSEERKAELLQSASIFALPSRAERGEIEGFGMVYAEAAAYGLPCVAGRSGGTDSAVIDGETGLLVNGADCEDVARGLSRLIEDRALARQLGEAGRERFWKEFAWDAAIARFEKLIFDSL